MTVFAAGHCRCRLLWIAALVALLAPVPPVSAAVTDTPLLELQRDSITAGDLATILPAWSGIDPAQVVAYAPLPGVERRIPQTELLRWARRHGVAVDAESLPPAVLVSRHMRRLTAAETVSALTDAVAQQFNVATQHVQARLVGFEEPLVPAGVLRFDLPSPLTRLNQPAHLSLRWRDADDRSGTLTIRPEVTVSGAFAQAKRRLEPGIELSGEDFAFLNGPLPGAPNLFPSTAEAIEGRVLRRPLEAGEALQTTMLVTPHTLRRGDLVELQVRSRSVLLRAPGRAEQSGSTGDEIRCRNLETGQQLRATIVDANHVEVIFP